MTPTKQLKIIDHETGEIVPAKKDRAYYVAEIGGLVSGMVDAIIETGQLLIEAKDRLDHGEFIPMIEEDLPFGERMARNFMSIANNEILANRQHVSDLPPAIGTLAEVARLPNPEIIARLESGDLSPETQRKDVIGWRREINRANIGDPDPWPDGKYAVIYADPPWRYEHVKTDSRKIENQYPTMALDEIMALPINSIANQDAVLFMWATSPKLEEAMNVINSWGFVYRTCMVWVKDRIGMGYYARQQHELLLIAAIGSLPVPEPSSRVSSVINAPRLIHSQKPQEAYEIIERMYPKYKKLELFSRTKRHGWDQWGNQA